MKIYWILTAAALIFGGGCASQNTILVKGISASKGHRTNSEKSALTGHKVLKNATGQISSLGSASGIELVGFDEPQDDQDKQDNQLDQEMQNEDSKSEQVLPELLPIESANAFASGSRYTLLVIEQIALENNPTLAAARAAICKASGLKQQVGTLPNPTLGYFGQQLADQGTSQNGLFLEREFVRGDKLRLNREILSHTMAAQQRELEAQQFRVLTDVRIRFYEAIAAQQTLEATRSMQSTAKRGIEIANQRKKAEEGSQIEVLQSETLSSEISLLVERAEIAFRAAWRDLAAIAGIPDSVPTHLEGDFIKPTESQDWEAVFLQIAQQSPELSVARALVCEKAAMLQRQRVQAIPNITGQLGAGYDNATDSGMINIQVSAPIPRNNKNLGNISAAQADYRQAVENTRRIEQSIKSRLARVVQDLESSLATVKKYEDQIIPQSVKSLELSEVAYKSGELDFLQVLILRRGYFESTLRSIEAKSQLSQAAAKIDGLLLTGGLDSPQDYTMGDGIREASFGGQ